MGRRSPVLYRAIVSKNFLFHVLYRFPLYERSLFLSNFDTPRTRRYDILYSISHLGCPRSDNFRTTKIKSLYLNYFWSLSGIATNSFSVFFLYTINYLFFHFFPSFILRKKAKVLKIIQRHRIVFFSLKTLLLLFSLLSPNNFLFFFYSTNFIPSIRLRESHRSKSCLLFLNTYVEFKFE